MSAFAKGEQNPRSKLTAAQVAEIRTLWEAGGVTQVQLAKRYGVGLSTMHHICRYETWRS